MKSVWNSAKSKLALRGATLFGIWMRSAIWAWVWMSFRRKNVFSVLKNYVKIDFSEIKKNMSGYGYFRKSNISVMLLELFYSFRKLEGWACKSKQLCQKQQNFISQVRLLLLISSEQNSKIIFWILQFRDKCYEKCSFGHFLALFYMFWICPQNWPKMLIFGLSFLKLIISMWWFLQLNATMYIIKLTCAFSCFRDLFFKLKNDSNFLQIGIN